MMLIAIVIFIAGSLICALAPSMIALVLGRALQGAGGGGLMVLAQTIIADIVSPRERGRYQGYIGAVFATSSIGGPVLGGFLTEHLDWSLIFWINLPLGLAALGMTSNVLKRVPFHPRKHRLDVIGALLMTSAAVALLLALSWGGRWFDWISAPFGALLLASAILWGLFAWRLVATRRAVSAARRARQSGGALRGARRRLQHGDAGRHDDFRAAVFRGGAASVRQPVRPGADPADGRDRGALDRHRPAADAHDALQAHAADRADAGDPVAWPRWRSGRLRCRPRWCWCC